MYAFDKRSRVIAPTTPKACAAAKCHFDFNNEAGRRDTADTFWGELESAAMNVVSETIRRSSLVWIDGQQKKDFCRFVAALYIGSQNKKAQLLETFADDVKSLGIEDHDRYQLQGTEEEAEAVFALSVIDGVDFVTEFLESKVWLLRTPAIGMRYVIGDSPATPHNDVPDGDGRQNLGLGAPNVQLLLPLAPHLMLHLVCPEFYNQCVKKGDVDPAPAGLAHPIVDTSDQSIRCNSIQLASAERFVYASNRSDFDFTEDLLNKRSDLARSWRVTKE